MFEMRLFLAMPGSVPSSICEVTIAKSATLFQERRQVSQASAPPQFQAKGRGCCRQPAGLRPVGEGPASELCALFLFHPERSLRFVSSRAKPKATPDPRFARYSP